MNLLHRWYCNSDGWRKTMADRVPWVIQDLDLGTNVLEIGPGPGLTTDILRAQYPGITAIEIDTRLADSLRDRLSGTDVRVIVGDAADMPFPDRSFTGITAMTMLHHVPTARLQDQLFSESYRVLKPGGVFAGSDSKPGFLMSAFHLFDTLNLVNYSELGNRLESVGFTSVEIAEADDTFRFRAKRPLQH